MKGYKDSGIVRRDFFALVGVSAVAASGVSFSASEAKADTAATQKRIDQITGGAEAKPSPKIRLKTPQIAENGRVVPISVRVESPMTADDYVKSLHLLVQENPSPEMATFHLTPACGKAELSIRCRMGATSPVIAIAEMSDGSFIKTESVVKVTIGGCGG